MAQEPQARARVNLGWVVLLLVAANSVLSMCLLRLVSEPRGSAPATPAGDTAAFDASLRAVQEPDLAAVDSLRPLVPGEPSTIWDHSPAPEHVLMATWTGYTGYDSVQGVERPLGVEVWVTPVPQLLERCRTLALAGPALAHRLRQYLGLAPEGKQDRIVEMWVRPADLFRPCPDPEIDDRACRVGLPEIPDAPVPAAALDHARWFQRRVASYYAPGALPWTRLGYTYDWGSPDQPVGASEYVIRRGAPVWVESITPTDAYCRASAPAPPRPDPAPR